MSELTKFEEDDAIKFIRAALPQSINERLSDDDLLYVIDCIWDWYERNGYLAISSDVTDEEEVNIDELVQYVKKELRRANELPIQPDDVEPIVKAELQYEESIEEF